MGALALIVLLSGGGYLMSCALHPMRHCRHCDGTPRMYGGLFSKSFRFCHVCTSAGRPGRERRNGTKMLVGLGLMKNPERAGSLGWRRANRRDGK